MFRLYEPAFTATLEEWGKLSKVLQVEKENQQMIMNTMSQAWTGQTQRDYDNICRELLTTGLYQQASEMVEKIYRIQLNMQPQIIAQMARCEKLGEQLQQDGYIPPYLSGQGYYNDGMLVLDEEYVAGVNSAVEEAVAEATEGRNRLHSAMDACGGIIDFSDERETLEAGYRKVKRIENFRTEFNRYVSGVREIERELTGALRAVMAADPDPSNLKWRNIWQNLNERRADRYTLQQMSLIAADLETYLDQMNVFTVSSQLRELVQTNEEGNYAFEELLQKDISELTDAELEKLKLLLGEICESIEHADPGDDCFIQKEMLERYFNNLYQLDVVYDYSYYGGKKVDECKVVSKDEMILAMLSEEEKTALADTMLRSICGTETRIDNRWYPGGIDFDMLEEIKSQALVDVKMELTEVGCAFSVMYCPDAPKREKYADKGVMEHYATSEIRIGNYVESLTSDEYSHLSSLGYDKAQLKDMLGMTQNRDDLRMVKYLMEGKTKDIFAIAPENFSDGAKNILAAYAINVGIKDMESGDSLHNLQNFTNDMLGAENWKEREYMEMMSVYCGLQREAVATAMWNSEGLDLTLIEKMEKVDAITGFYQSLYIAGYDMQLDYAMLTRQKLHILVSDLQIDGGVTYTINGYNQKPENNPLKSNVVSRTHWDSLQANSDLFTNEMNEINKQMQTLWQSCALDIMIKSVGLIDGNCAQILELGKAIGEDSIKDGISAVTELKVGKKELSKGTVCAADIFGALADYHQKKEKLEANYKKAGINSMVSWFYSSNVYNENQGMNQLYHTGIYNGATIEAIKEWNQKGIASFHQTEENLGNVFFNETGASIELNRAGWHQINSLDKYSDQEIKDAMLLLLFGEEGYKTESGTYVSALNSVLNIEPELFTRCIEEINDQIPNSQLEQSLQSSWAEKRNSYSGLYVEGTE